MAADAHQVPFSEIFDHENSGAGLLSCLNKNLVDDSRSVEREQI